MTQLDHISLNKWQQLLFNILSINQESNLYLHDCQNMAKTILFRLKSAQAESKQHVLCGGPLSN